MDSIKIFRTKTGYCHILPDKIVLSKDGSADSVTEDTSVNNIARVLVVYGIVAIGLVWIAFRNLSNGEVVLPVLFLLIAVYLSVGIARSLNNSATPVIYRDKIKSVKYRKGIQGLTRSRFEVYFINGNGKQKKRIIMLPGSLSDGQDETAKALTIMVDEKLIVL